MKKIIISIICSVFFFSSIFSLNAQGLLSDILELDTGIEKFTLESIPQLPEKTFKNISQQSSYNNFKIIDQALREEFIRQYTEKKIDYYQMQDLIESYRNFLYYTEKTFDYISDHEKDSRKPEIHQAIISSYGQMRAYYIKIQNILS